MLEDEGLKSLVREIEGQGFAPEIADLYAARIGDRPIVDEKGNIIVTDERGKELASLKPLKFFEE